MTVSIQQHVKILVFNPNTSESVTDSLKPILSKVDLPDMELTYWTCPTGPTLIKTQAHMYESTMHCIPLLLDIIDNFDGFLGACYADHPVVRLLQSYVGNKPVVGIFDASILAALQLTSMDSKFGIITTGIPFEVLLAEGVEHFLQDKEAQQLRRFGGVAASGIGADDLDPIARERARQKLMAATARLVRSGEVNVLCVGGVILAGMEPWIREACVQELGIKRGMEVKIVEQLAAGAVALGAILRNDPFANFSAALR